MSITTQPGATFTAIATGFPQGLEATLVFGVRQLPEGTLLVAQTTGGIVEYPQPGGVSNYAATRTIPGDAPPTDQVLGVEYETAWPSDLIGEQEAIVVAASLAPALGEVANHLEARIVDENGNELAVWTTSTSPTAAQVQAKIAVAVRDVRRDAGAFLDAPDDQAIINSARDLAAIRAALYVEQSFYPEQTSSTLDVYPLLKRLYDEGLRGLQAAIRRSVGIVLESRPTT